jgi:alpha-ketoglutaric semialdehyde dehydrogenase
MADIFSNFIAGKSTLCRSGKTFPNINPADNDDVVGLFQESGPEDVEQAFEAAIKARSSWAAMSAPVRGEYLFRAADLLEGNLHELGKEMTREEGKTLPEAKGEVKRAINIFRYFGGEGARQFGSQIPSERQNVFCYTLRRPLGVVALITPWNFPSAIPAWKMAPALVAGNTVVIKPASLAPLSSYRLVEALHNAGIPAGVLNYVTGGGREVGQPMVDHPAVRAISFTGSCGVGNRMQQGLNSRKVRLQLEMGGKNPTIVLKDANIDYAAEVLVNGAFFSTGQKCTACSRAILERTIYEPLVEKLLSKTSSLKIGNGLEEGVQVGPAVDQAQLDTDLRYIDIALKEGAHLLHGGKRLAGDAYDKGFFLEPTIFTDVQPSMRIVQEEVFGPVLVLQVASDFEEAIQLANDVQFGLSASIVTKDLTYVHQFVNRIEAGLITVNLPTAGVEYQLPFGGIKESSFGMREQGPAAIDFYTETHTVYLKYTQQ